MQFKKPARLECMMQDYPKLLDASVKVGFTVVEKWLGYSPVKNNKADALKVKCICLSCILFYPFMIYPVLL